MAVCSTTMDEAGPPTILIVDDDEEIADLIEEYIHMMGDYRTLTAYSGLGGLAMAETSPPDLVVLDIMMEDMEGTEVCRRIRANSKTADVPVVAVTVIKKVQKSRYWEIMEAGFDEYIEKPFEYEELKEVIERLL
jgi:DNA-binding response OmpR family regulator